MDKAIRFVSAAVVGAVVILVGIMAWGIFSGSGVEPEPEDVIAYQIDGVDSRGGGERITIHVSIDQPEPPSDDELRNVAISAMHAEEGHWVDETLVHIYSPQMDRSGDPYAVAEFDGGSLIDQTIGSSGEPWNRSDE